jgi:hypothetical protein
MTTPLANKVPPGNTMADVETHRLFYAQKTAISGIFRYLITVMTKNHHKFL